MRFGIERDSELFLIPLPACKLMFFLACFCVRARALHCTCSIVVVVAKRCWSLLCCLLCGRFCGVVCVRTSRGVLCCAVGVVRPPALLYSKLVLAPHLYSLNIRIFIAICRIFVLLPLQ